jgi:amidohydrolase
VVNDAAVIGRVRHAIEARLGPDAAEDTMQSMGSEDFSIYLEQIPGAMIRLGSGRTDREADLHSASFDIDEDALEPGILIAAASLIELLRD